MSIIVVAGLLNMVELNYDDIMSTTFVGSTFSSLWGNHCGNCIFYRVWENGSVSVINIVSILSAALSSTY